MIDNIPTNQKVVFSSCTDLANSYLPINFNNYDLFRSSWPRHGVVESLKFMFKKFFASFLVISHILNYPNAELERSAVSKIMH